MPEIENETAPTETATIWPPPPADQPVAPGTFQGVRPRMFPRMNVPLLVLLHFCTVGLYSLFWIKRTISIANERAGRTVVSPFALWVVVAMWVIIPSFDILFMLEPLFPALAQFINFMPADQLLNTLTLAGDVVWIVVAFMVRRGIIESLDLSQHDLAYIEPVGTFFFSIFYFQYKINTFLKHNPNATAPL